MREIVIERQLLHLRGGDIYWTLLVEADGDAPQAGHALNEAVAMAVGHIDSIPVLNDPRPLFSMGCSVGVAMKMISNITCLVRVWSHIHSVHHLLILAFIQAHLGTRFPLVLAANSRIWQAVLHRAT